MKQVSPKHFLIQNMIEPFKNKSATRLKKARGQIDGIMKMIDENEYCIDIITQLLALQGALKSVTHLVLESHLNTCSLPNLVAKKAKKREKFIRELIKVCELSSR